jgi:hypothetical protein
MPSTNEAVRLGFALGAIPTVGLVSLLLSLLLTPSHLSLSFSAMLLTSYLMYKYSFGKVVEGCIQFFAGGLIFAIGMFVFTWTLPHLLQLLWSYFL